MASTLIRGITLAVATALAFVAVLPGAPGARAAAGYVPISGDGSSWAANAVDQWITDVHQYGMRVNYNDVGSGQGRTDFLNHTVDFAVSDIPFQTHPSDGSAPEQPVQGSYAYMPIVAGGTSFMYHLTIDGHKVTNLRLSGANIAKIFTGVITQWNDPALAADNPGLRLPNEKIIPVVRSDSSGSSAQFSLWMIAQQPSIWNAYYQKLGRGSTGGETSYWPTTGAMIAQSGDLGVAGYITQPYAEGSIGYVQYSYALNAGYPVAKMLNADGYYTEPTPTNVAVSLTQAKINMDARNPAVYLTQNLSRVYSYRDPRTYPMSSYSYMILPTTVQGAFSTAKGTTLGAFSYFFMCQGQQQAPQLGYSPLPINLVEAGFQQILKIPGVVKQNITVSGCNNPTFDPANPNNNHLAEIAPYPKACDKHGSTQCATGTGGDTNPTPVSGAGGTGTGGSGTGGTGTGGTGTGGTGGSGSGTGTGGTGSTGGGTTGGTGGGTGSAGSGSAGTGSAAGAAGTGSTGSGSAGQAINPDTGLPVSPPPGRQGTSGQLTGGTSGTGTAGGTAGTGTTTGTAGGQPVNAQPVALTDSGGWGGAQFLIMLVCLALIAFFLAPPLLFRYLTRPQGPGSRP